MMKLVRECCAGRLASAAVLTSAILGIAAAPGCAAEPENVTSASADLAVPAGLRFSKDAVNVDAVFSNSVSVEDDRLVVPKASNGKTLSRIRVGSIVAG